MGRALNGASGFSRGVETVGSGLWAMSCGLWACFALAVA